MKEWNEDRLLDYKIGDRFEAERHPVKTVDGDDEWELDPFAEEA